MQKLKYMIHKSQFDINEQCKEVKSRLVINSHNLECLSRGWQGYDKKDSCTDYC